jgi:hypothetical protein
MIDTHASQAATLQLPMGRTAFPWLLLAGVGLLLLIPGNFVELKPAWVTISNLLVVATSLLALLSILRHSRVRMQVLTTIAILCLLSVLAGASINTAFYFFLPFLIGAGLGAALDQRLFAVFSSLIAIITFASVVLDAAVKAPITSSMFGVPLQLSELTGTRARGLIGQPVPAAFASVLFFAILLPLAVSTGTKRRRLLFGAALGIQLVVTLVLTGTRSALVLGAVVTLLMLMHFAAKFRGRFLLPLTLWSPALLAVFLGLFLTVGNTLSGSRVGDFRSLQGSTSLTNRLYALDYLHRWATSDNFVAIAIGNGPRSLQSNLTSYQGSRLSTIDNLYVTILWDFGVVGALVLLAALFVFLSRFSGSPVVIGAALGGITILASGTAYDSLYTRFMAIIFAALVVLCLKSSPDRLRRGHDEPERPYRRIAW